MNRKANWMGGIFATLTMVSVLTITTNCAHMGGSADASSDEVTASDSVDPGLNAATDAPSEEKAAEPSNTEADKEIAELNSAASKDLGEDAAEADANANEMMAAEKDQAKNDAKDSKDKKDAKDEDPSALLATPPSNTSPADAAAVAKADATDTTDAAKADATDPAAAANDQFAIPTDDKKASTPQVASSNEKANEKKADALPADEKSLMVSAEVEASRDALKNAAQSEATPSSDDAVPTDGATDSPVVAKTETPAPTLAGEKADAVAEPTDAEAKPETKPEAVVANAGDKVDTDEALDDGKPAGKVKKVTQHKKTKVPQESSEMVASQTPKVPVHALHRKGEMLNRYYFLRSGDTADKVSQLVYGTPERAKSLKGWNRGKAWTPGQVIFYPSLGESADDGMHGFYEEGHAAAETYVVKAGDKLSTIAEQKYGDPRSWRELAVENHVKNPDRIFPGQTLTFYTMSEASQVAKASDIPATGTAAAKADAVDPAVAAAPAVAATQPNALKAEENSVVATQGNPANPVSHDMAKEDTQAVAPKADAVSPDSAKVAQGESGKPVDGMADIDAKLKADIESKQKAAMKHKLSRKLASADDMTQVLGNYFWLLSLGGMGLLFGGLLISRRIRRARAESDLLD